MDFDFANWWLILRRIAAEPFRPKRALFLASVFVGLTMFSLASFAGLALDHVFFPGFRRVKIKEPVFIVGNGRSGTTIGVYIVVSYPLER